MNHHFKINDFEGPLDLLLHLVRVNKMDIYEIEVSKIIAEYINFIKEMEELNIDIASEYLVMAAELVHLKSRILINRNDEEEDNDEYSINSEEDLKNKIIEYQKYKEVSHDLKTLEEKRSEIFTKIPESLKNYLDDGIEITKEMDVQDLINAFLIYQEREELKKPVNTKITKKEYSVDDRIISIRNKLKKHNKINFIDLFDILSKNYIIVTFLSILEMSKNNEIKIKQKQNFDEIIIEAK